MRVRTIFLLVRRGTGVTGGIERRGWGHRRAPRDVERPLCCRRVVAQPGAARRRHAVPPRRVSRAQVSAVRDERRRDAAATRLGRVHRRGPPPPRARLTFRVRIDTLNHYE